MKQILCYLPTDAAHREKLAAAAPGCTFSWIEDGAFTPEQLAGAEIVLGNIPASLLPGMENLRMVQLNSAGTDGYLVPGVLREDVILCNATGSYGLAIGEYLTAMALMLIKKFHLYRDQQRDGSWADHGKVRTIVGSRTLVVGLGDIGSEFAARMGALGSHVRGIKRTPGGSFPGVEEVGSYEDLDAWLKEADIIGMALPDTPQTRGIMNRERLMSLKPGAILLNVGRGTAIDQEALVEAVQAGIVGGAGLDVTAPEPLPADHPLWQLDNVFITPHVSGGLHLQETHDRMVELFCRNLRNYFAGAPMESLVDRATGYRASK